METAGPQRLQDDAHRRQEGAGEVCQGYEDEGRSVHLGVGSGGSCALSHPASLSPLSLAVCQPEIMQVSGVLRGACISLFGVLSSPYNCLVEGFPLQPGKHSNPYLSLAVRELLSSLLSSVTPDEGDREVSAWLGLELLGRVAWWQVEGICVLGLLCQWLPLINGVQFVLNWGWVLLPVTLAGHASGLMSTTLS